jgi:hypothetical protein
MSMLFNTWWENIGKTFMEKEGTDIKGLVKEAWYISAYEKEYPKCVLCGNPIEVTHEYTGCSRDCRNRKEKEIYNDTLWVKGWEEGEK